MFIFSPQLYFNILFTLSKVFITIIILYKHKNGTKYTMAEDTNYLLMKYAGNIINYGLGKHMEMKNEYVLIRVKADKPTVIADVVIFQGIN